MDVKSSENGFRAMNRVESELKELLRKGASLIGFADLGQIPERPRGLFKYAVSIAVALNPKIVSAIYNGPTLGYYKEYKRANELLSVLGTRAEDILKDRGYGAIALDPTTEDFDADTLRTDLPHKTAATRAGLGWIGKNALLITKEYGSALRLTTVLTDARLKTSNPINSSNCGRCRICVDVCPGRAPHGDNWSVGMDRDLFFSAHSCYKAAGEYSKKLGVESAICGICISACPWTKRYVGRKIY